MESNYNNNYTRTALVVSTPSIAVVVDLSNRHFSNIHLVKHVLKTYYSSSSGSSNNNNKKQDDSNNENSYSNALNCTVLNLSGNELTTVPSFLVDVFPHIRTLDISNNESLVINRELIYEVLSRFHHLEHLVLDWSGCLMNKKQNTVHSGGSSGDDDDMSHVEAVWKDILRDAIPTLLTINNESVLVGLEDEQENYSVYHQNIYSNNSSSNSSNNEYLNELTLDQKNRTPPSLIVRNQSDVLEAVFFFYQDLLAKLRQWTITSDTHEKMIHEQRLTHFYQKLKNRLELELEICSPNQYKSLIRQAKYHLFNVYHRELIQSHKNHNQMEMAEQMEDIFLSHNNIFTRYRIDDPSNKVGLRSRRRKESIRIDTSTKAPTSSQVLENQSRKQEELVESPDLGIPITPTATTDHDTPTSSANLDTNSHARVVIEPKEQENIRWSTRIYKWLATFLPIIVWVPEYRHHLPDLKNDLVAGLTVGIMVIPQSMAYSLIAGLPPVYGLYAALIPLFIYAIFGTSRQLAVGPTAVASLLVASGLSQLNESLEPGSNLYIAYALIISLICGSVQILLGLFRLGFLVNFLSHPVLSGFTSAAAIIIAGSQLTHLLGVKMSSNNHLHYLIWNIIKAVPLIHYPTLIFGILSIGFLAFFDRFYFNLTRDMKFRIRNREFNFGRQINLKRIPAALLLVVLGILSLFIVKRAGNYDASNNDVFGIRIVGHIPVSFPKPSVPRVGGMTAQMFKDVLLMSLPVALVGFMEAISIAKYYSLQRGYDIDPNQELIAVGMSNLIGGFFKAYPTTGSISRTAVNANCNAVSPLSGIISAILVLFTILFLTPLFYYLPMPVLAAMIIYSCTKVPDFDEVIFTFKTKKRDCILLGVAFLGTLFIGITEGILIAAIASLAMVIYRSSRPRFHLLGRQPGTNLYQEVKQSPSAIELPGVLVARFDSDMYFANVGYFKDRVKRFIRKSKYPVYSLVLDCSSINQVDSTAAEALIEVIKFLKTQSIELFIAQMKPSISQVMKKAGIGNHLPETSFWDNLHDAVIHADAYTKRRAVEEASRIEQEQQQRERTTTDGSSSDSFMEPSMERKSAASGACDDDHITVELKTMPNNMDHIVLEIENSNNDSIYRRTR